MGVRDLFEEPELTAALRAWNTNFALEQTERMRTALAAAKDAENTRTRTRNGMLLAEIDNLRNENRKLRRVNQAVETGEWPVNDGHIPPPRLH
jgi:cell division protein FtsB